MRTGTGKTKWGRWAGIIAATLLVSVALVPMTRAAEETAGRSVFHTQKVESMEVGDVPGHVVGVAETPGMIFFSKGPETGKTAARMGVTVFDIVNGKGTNTGYAVVTFQDGSTLSYKISGTTTPADGGKKSVIEGTYELTGGTGRYEGTKGKGTYKGERVGSLKTGGDAYADFSGTDWK